MRTVRSLPRPRPSIEARSTVTRWIPASRHGFNVSVTSPKAPERASAIVYPMPYDYRIDRLALDRMEILAARTNRTVVGVESPGITLDEADPVSASASSVRADVLLAQIGGDYRPAASLQLSAIDDVLGGLPTELHLVGESLGAQFSAAIAGLIPCRSLTLVEPTNCVDRGWRGLLRQGKLLRTIEESRRDQYVAVNAQRGWPPTLPFEKSGSHAAAVDRRLKRFRHQGKYALASALGMRKSLASSLERVDAGLDVVRVWRGIDSTVCLAADVAVLSARMAPRLRVEETVMVLDGLPAGHHFLTEMDAMMLFADTLAGDIRHPPETVASS